MCAGSATRSDVKSESNGLFVALNVVVQDNLVNCDLGEHGYVARPAHRARIHIEHNVHHLVAEHKHIVEQCLALLTQIYEFALFGVPVDYLD